MVLRRPILELNNISSYKQRDGLERDAPETRFFFAKRLTRSPLIRQVPGMIR